MAQTNNFASTVLEKLIMLNTTGKKYRRITHTLNDIILSYTENMQNKNNYLGNAYIDKMNNSIQTIFTKIFEKQNYDALEFINNVINWYFKCLAVKYNLIKIPTGLEGTPINGLPDYTIAEIHEISKTLL